MLTLLLAHQHTRTIQTLRARRREILSIIVSRYSHCPPRGKVPTGGTVIRGESSIDEAMLTGESFLVNKVKGDVLIGGTINIDGDICRSHVNRQRSKCHKNDQTD